MNVSLCTENKEETGKFITSIKKQSAGLKVLHVIGKDFASKKANPEDFIETIMDEYQKFDVLIFEGADYLKRSFLGETAFNELVKKYMNNGKQVVITSLDFPWYSGLKGFVNENFCKKFKLLFLNSNGEYSVIDDETFLQLMNPTFETELILKKMSVADFRGMPKPVPIDNETYKHIHIELHLKAGGPIVGTFAGIRRDVDCEVEALGYNVI